MGLLQSLFSASRTNKQMKYASSGQAIRRYFLSSATHLNIGYSAVLHRRYTHVQSPKLAAQAFFTRLKRLQKVPNAHSTGFQVRAERAMTTLTFLRRSSGCTTSTQRLLSTRAYELASEGLRRAKSTSFPTAAPTQVTFCRTHREIVRQDCIPGRQPLTLPYLT